MGEQLKKMGVVGKPSMEQFITFAKEEANYYIELINGLRHGRNTARPQRFANIQELPTDYETFTILPTNVAAQDTNHESFEAVPPTL